MEFEKITAKNGESSLKVNGVNLYSSYRPSEQVNSYISKEVDVDSKGYILFGLGLGYHLISLIRNTKLNKPIICCCFDEKEIDLFEEVKMKNTDVDFNQVKIITNFIEMEIDVYYQVIIPEVWLTIIGDTHPLFNHLQDMKIRQKSFKKNEKIMYDNFQINIKNNDFILRNLKLDRTDRVACLVSAGPSLDKTLYLLKKERPNLYIIVVGAALQALLSNQIVPDSVIITDANEVTLKQLNGQYDIPLFYLSTVYKDIPSYFNGPRCILLQHGYSYAEKKALEMDYPLVETGGSVATTAFSILEYLGFKNIVLFGQDLGFKYNETHSSLSSSNEVISNRVNTMKVISNSGEKINTLKNLLVFKKWFESKFERFNGDVYNTALEGALIQGAPYINEEQFLQIVRNKRDL